MLASTSNFFEGKREWSKIKDQVLSKYMPAYLGKVNTLLPPRPILLIDGYAGPGIFDDGSKGSPYIICSVAEKQVKGNYQAIFINKHLKYHRILEQVIQENDWTSSAKAVRNDSLTWLQNFSQTLRNETIFLYLDPFGPTGCTFETLKPFLTRNKAYSTEILLTMNMPGIPRLAARHAVAAGRGEEKAIQMNHRKLTKIFGGDYWQDIMFRLDLSDEERGKCLIDA
jgi:three-Cys-motif partner protein